MNPHPPTEDRREPDALEAAATEIHSDWCEVNYHAGHVESIVAIMRRHRLRGPEQWICDDCGWVMAINKESCWNCDAPRYRTAEEER